MSQPAFSSKLATALFSTVLLCANLPLQAAELPRTPAPEGARVYIVSPQDGSTVKSPVTVIFGLEGMGVAPAGVDAANSGHHHLLVDMEALPDMNQPLGAGVTHFGGGQTQVQLPLAPGQHTLQLLMGDKLHIPHQPPVLSDKITITVK